MSSTTNMGDMLDVAERYQRTFVKPLVDAVTNQIDTHLAELNQRLATVEAAVKTNSADITTLKANEKKALVGWSLYASGAALLFAAGWSWFKSKIHFG